MQVFIARNAVIGQMVGEKIILCGKRSLSNFEFQFLRDMCEWIPWDMSSGHLLPMGTLVLLVVNKIRKYKRIPANRNVRKHCSLSVSHCVCVVLLSDIGFVLWLICPCLF